MPSLAYCRQDCSIEDLSCHLRATDSLAAASTASRRREEFKFLFCAESRLDRAVNIEGTRQIKYFDGVVARYEQLVEEPELVLVQRREVVSTIVEGQ